MDEYELEEVKREIVEGRALAIRTNNLVNALSADLKAISRRQQATERRYFVNAALVYVISMVAVLVLTKVASDARLETAKAEASTTRERVAALTTELQALQQAEEARVRVSRQAAELWDLAAQGKRRELLERWPEVQKLALTRTERAAFESAVAKARAELSLLDYQEGLEHVRAGRWHEAQASLRACLAQQPEAAHAPVATLELGRALTALGRQREAITLLSQLSESSPDREVMDDATFLLAKAQVEIQAWNDAKGTLRSLIRRFPTSPFANPAKTMLAELTLEH